MTVLKCQDTPTKQKGNVGTLEKAQGKAQILGKPILLSQSSIKWDK
jgi:hypothetical protein